MNEHDDGQFEDLRARYASLNDIAPPDDVKDGIRAMIEQSAGADLHAGTVRRRRKARPTVKALMPGFVAGAAVVIATGGIVGIMANKRSPGVPSLPPSIGPTNGSRGSAMGVVAAGSQNIWFILVMAILVAGMAVTYLTRHRQPRWEWLRQTLVVVRSPIAWGATIGIAVGIRGLPVPVPTYADYWVWEMPSGHYVASVAGMCVIGCLIGGMIQFGRRKVLPWHVSWWMLGSTSLILLIGIMAFFRSQAGTRDTLWGDARIGLIQPFVASENMNASPPQRNVNILGADLLDASSFLVTVVQQQQVLGTKADFYDAANMFYNVGIVLVDAPHQSRQAVRQAENFLAKIEPIYRRNIGKTASPQNIERTISAIVAVAPKQYFKLGAPGL
ncbi:hypothetical protein [Alicyclobacillus sp. ALC3]|uniref:hypothetical protein n=1 Tax=Alicyclobacillus sp. ALC3 TaxID=2796143 RepID=UPI00237825B0|nr:hypothetical protein [Alicyclobacillus sp. ALC3]WDL95817.1 anti-sigma factor [Alicyclobacillus sp. ALC3]